MIEVRFKRHQHRAGWGGRIWLFKRRRWLQIGWFHHDPTYGGRFK